MGAKYVKLLDPPTLTPDATANLGKCARCRKPFEVNSLIIKSQNASWHFECMHCDYCKCSMDEPCIIINNKNFMCRACYENKHPDSTLEIKYDKEICPRCGKNIDGMMIYAQNRYWHNDCLVCGLCEEPVSTWYYAHSYLFPLCQNCFSSVNTNSNQFNSTNPRRLRTQIEALRNFRPCFKCKENIDRHDKCITAYNKTYHKQCFTCILCKVVIHGLYNAPSNAADPYCFKCYMKEFGPKCHACGEIIYDDTFQVFKGYNFHNSCFICLKCKDSLVNEDFVVVHGMFMCPKHVFSIY